MPWITKYFQKIPLNFRINFLMHIYMMHSSDLFRLHHRQKVLNINISFIPMLSRNCVYLFESEREMRSKICFNILRCAYFYFNRTIYFTFSVDLHFSNARKKKKKEMFISHYATACLNSTTHDDEKCERENFDRESILAKKKLDWNLSRTSVKYELVLNQSGKFPSSPVPVYVARHGKQNSLWFNDNFNDTAHLIIFSPTMHRNEWIGNELSFKKAAAAVV